MPRLHPFARLALATLLLAACGEETPTQPESPAPLAPSAAVAALAANTWTPRAPLPFFNEGYGVGAAPNSAGQWLVYTFGGGDEEDCTQHPGTSYNVVTNTWTTLPFSTVFASNLNGVATLGGRLFFSGGSYFCDTEIRYYTSIWAYDPKSDRVTVRADLPRATDAGTSGAIGGKLYVLAGFCTGELDVPGHCVTGSPVRQFYRYDPATNAVAFRAQPPHLHTFGGSGVIGGKLYVVGGLQGRDLDVYDPGTNTWKPGAPYPVAHTGYFAAALGSQLYVIGWTSGSGGGYDLTAYSYNPATNTWRVRAKPPIRGNGFVRVMLDGKPRLFLPGRPASYLYTP